jgi:predicted XRE-type DNA-binding protein
MAEIKDRRENRTDPVAFIRSWIEACEKRGMSKSKKRTITPQAERVEPSSGNVFADVEERMFKAQLAVKIAELIEREGWTQARTAEVIGLDQPKVSHLLRGRLSGFSADRLFAILNRLGHSVEVRIEAVERAPNKTRTSVMFA